MSELETTEGGYKIRYSEWNDKWECKELGLTSVTLSGLRKSIKNKAAQLRKLDGLSLISLCTYSYNSELGQIFSAKLLPEDEPDYVWVINDKGSRSKESLDKFAIDSPKARELMKVYKDLQGEIDQLKREANEILDGITRVSLDDLLEHRIIKD